MKTRTWIIIFAALLLACALAILLPRGGGGEAGVYLDGELVFSQRLSELDSEFDYALDAGDAHMIIRFTRDGVSVLSSNCKNQLCVRRGELLPGGAPVVCLPNRVVVKWISENSGVDAVTG